MGNLITMAALTGQAEHAGMVLCSPDFGRITSVAPFSGKADAVAKVLKGLGFPRPNSFLTNGQSRIVWTGRDQAFLIGADPTGLEGLAALTDQSDGWACLSLTGAAAAECLMRLIPLDLHKMQPGAAARAPLGHMQSVIMRTEGGFELLVFRSMAKTAWHEVTTAMKALAARQTLGC